MDQGGNELVLVAVDVQALAHVVPDQAGLQRQAVVDQVRTWGTGAGLNWIGVCESPIKGPAGNVEFLACWKKDKES